MANHCNNVITITSSDLETSRKLNEEFSFSLDENIDAFEVIKEKYKFANLFKAKRKKLFKN